MITKPNFTASKNSGLQTARLRVINLEIFDHLQHSIKAFEENFSLYTDTELMAKLKKEGKVKCIVSFQWYHDGRRVAVAKVFKSRVNKNA